MLIRKIQRRLTNAIAGRKGLQSIFENLLYISLRVLNYNNGKDVDENGESYFLKQVHKRYSKEDNIIIFDVGANVGRYSAQIHKIFGSKAMIYAFEPSADTYGILLNNIKDITNVIPNNIGLSDRNGEQTLFTTGLASELASFYNRNLDHYNINMSQNESIKLQTLDDYCGQHNIEKIHFLKLDVEGHELSILKGAQKMLSENRIDNIQFEFGGANIDSRTYFQDFYYMLKDKYKIYRILKNGLAEVTAYTEGLEIFYLINFVAVRKI